MSTQEPNRTEPPGQGGHRRTKRAGLLIGVVGGVLLWGAVTALVVTFVLGRGGASTPDEAVRAYLDAMIADDCDTLVEHPIVGYPDAETCTKALADSDRQGLEGQKLGYDRVEVMDESGIEATVSVNAWIEYEQDGDQSESELDLTFTVVKSDDGDWVVTGQEFPG